MALVNSSVHGSSLLHLQFVAMKEDISGLTVVVIHYTSLNVSNLCVLENIPSCSFFLYIIDSDSSPHYAKIL